MIIFLAILGITLPVLLIYHHANRSGGVYYLGGFFLLICLYGINHYLLMYSRSVFTLVIFMVNFSFLFYLIGPLLYLYIRSNLTDNYRLKKWDLLHLIPMALWFVIAVPYLLKPFSYKLDIARQFAENHDGTSVFRNVFVDNELIIHLIFISRPLLILFYTVWAANLMIKYKKKNKIENVFQRQKFVNTWIYLLIAITGILALSNLFLMIETSAHKDLDIYLTMNILQGISAAGLTGLLISPFFFPEILYGMPRLPGRKGNSKNPNPGLDVRETSNPLLRSTGKPVGILSGLNHEDSPVTEIPKTNGDEKKNIIHLETAYLTEIGRKADECMHNFRPYLQIDFNLIRLAVMINIPAHHLSYYFREIKQQNFTDYRNHWRIMYAKKLIQEGKAEEMTLEAIGRLAGFLSRNAFIASFKKIEGV